MFGFFGILYGMALLVNPKNIPVEERKKGLMIFGWSLLLLLIGVMLTFFVQ